MSKDEGFDPDYVRVNLIEYQQLKRDSKILDLLRSAGVDNWEWYGEALEGLDDA